MNVLEIENVYKTYRDGEANTRVLEDINLQVPEGEFVSIQGASGVGKSTFLNLVAALDKPDSGNIKVNGLNLDEYYKSKSIHLYRQKQIGFIFQNHYLLPDFTVLENVMLPLLNMGFNKKISAEKAQKILDQIGLLNRGHHYPSQISGGESQRVAVARAMVHEPPLILADEPTGNLDNKNTQMFVDLLTNLQKERNLTILLVTHDTYLASLASMKKTMKDGRLF